MNEGDDTLLSNLGAILWHRYRYFSQEDRIKLKRIANKYKGGENLHYFSWSDELINAAENGDEQSKFELIERGDIDYPKIDFSGWIKNVDIGGIIYFEHDIKAFQYGIKVGVFKSSNPFKDYFIKRHINNMFFIHDNNQLVNDYRFEVLSNEHYYWIGKFAYEMGDDLYIDPKYEQCIDYYFNVSKKTRDAIDAWSIIAKRLGVVKDIRILIGKLLWKEKREWIPPTPKSVEYEETHYYDWEWIEKIFMILYFLFVFYSIIYLYLDYFICGKKGNGILSTLYSSIQTLLHKVI